MDIQPRTLGETFDDAWRFALADAPFLLLFNALFLVPAFIVLLLLLTQPVPAGVAQYVLPALAALMLSLTGLASGACQELFRQRVADEPVLVRHCLTASLRRGSEHTAARAVLLCFTLPGPLLFIVSFLPDTSSIMRFVGFLFGSLLTVLLSFPLCSACTSLHVLLASAATRRGTLLSELRRDVAAAPGKAAVLVLSRIPLLPFLALQLHLLAKVLLWSADNLAGFDMTLLEVQLVLFEEPLYTTALFFLSWLLLSPFFESSNFLLHTDVRTRQEGLDLQYRVQRAFGGALPPTRVPARGVVRSLTVAALVFLFGGMARADKKQSETIHAIRGEIETIYAEIQKTDPYPGGQRWHDRLHNLQVKLSLLDGDPRRFRWFERAIVDFADRKKPDSLRILEDLQRRLSLLEDALTPNDQADVQVREKHTPEEIKSFLRDSEGRDIERDHPRRRVEEDNPERRREEDRRKEQREEPPRTGGGRGKPVSVPAASNGGLSSVGWFVLGGLGLAVIVTAVVLYLISPRSPRTPKPKTSSGKDSVGTENETRQVLEQSPAALWRQADTLADDGRFRDAVRVLYLAALALLHRQRLIRFEPTRTNGEYVRQVRLSEQAPPELHRLFEQLTQHFETAWYGERPCESGDYRAGRVLAVEMQQVAVGV